MIPESGFLKGLDNFLGAAYEHSEALENMRLYQKLLLSHQDPASSMHLNVSLKKDWYNKHLEKFDLELRGIVQQAMKKKVGPLMVPAEELDQEIAWTLKHQPAVLCGLFKDLLFLAMRNAQWTEVMSEYLSKGLETCLEIFSEIESNLKTEFNNKIKNQQAKILALEKLLKSLKDTPISQKTAPKSSKADKELEKLKVKLISLENQNSYLVAREKALETKLKDGSGAAKEKEPASKEPAKKKKEKTTSLESSSKSKNSQLLMVFDAPEPGLQSKKISGVKKVKKISKQERMDRFETSIMDYCTVLSAAVLSEPELPSGLFESGVFEGLLELVIEIVPKINSKKELLVDRSGFMKGILEVAVRLIDGKKRVRFSEEQMLVCVPDVLPLNFNPKTSFWIKALDPKSHVLEAEKDPNKPVPKFVVQDPVTRQLQSYLTGFVNYLRMKLSELSEKAANLRSKDDHLQPSSAPIKALEIRQSLRKLLELINQRSLLTKTLLLCYLFIERVAFISGEQHTYYREEAEELLAERHWKDLPALGKEISLWYTRLAGIYS